MNDCLRNCTAWLGGGRNVAILLKELLRAYRVVYPASHLRQSGRIHITKYFCLDHSRLELRPIWFKEECTELIKASVVNNGMRLCGHQMGRVPSSN